MRASAKIKFIYTGSDPGIEAGRVFTVNKIYDVLEFIPGADFDAIRALVVDDNGHVVQTREPLDSSVIVEGVWEVVKVKVAGPNSTDVILINIT